MEIALRIIAVLLSIGLIIFSIWFVVLQVQAFQAVIRLDKKIDRIIGILEKK